MKILSNQKGYALLVVLFLIVFIITVMAIFMRGSISTAKQEQLVDNNNMAFVAAEMGMDYYLSFIGNDEIEIFKETKSELGELNKRKCNQEGKPGNCLKLEHIKEAINKKYFEGFESTVKFLNNNPTPTIKTDTKEEKIYFDLSYLGIESSASDSFVLLKIIVGGVSPTEKSSLESYVTYTLPEIIEEGPGSEIPKDNIITNPFDVFPENANGSGPCTNNGSGQCDGKGKIYYTEGTINYKNPNNMKNFIWFHKGLFETGKVMQNLNATIVLESLKTKNNIKNIYGNLVLIGKNNNSGELSFSGAMDTKNNGQICVNLDGYSKSDIQNLNISGKIVYYSSDENAKWPRDGKNINAVKSNSLSEFIQNCIGLPITSGEDGDESDNLNGAIFKHNNVDVEIKVDYKPN